VLDATALTTAADERSDARGVLRRWQEDGADVLTTAATLTEVLRGHPRDALIHRLLASLSIRVVDEQLGRAAGERIGRSAVRGNVTLDALVAELASSLPRPVVVLTSDVDDISALVDDDVMVLDIAS
jgi:hypothetical protein